jgi:CheY-like chemotaxis protein
MSPGSDKNLVLIVEDDRDISSSVAELLEDSGFATCVAFNGAEALKMLNSGVRPSVILLDLMMPVMDGFAFRDAQRKDPALAMIPVVVMSADGNLAERQSRAQANAYIRKPLDIDALIAVVQEYCVS